jgi:hypothetical protein
MFIAAKVCPPYCAEQLNPAFVFCALGEIGS